MTAINKKLTDPLPAERWRLLSMGFQLSKLLQSSRAPLPITLYCIGTPTLVGDSVGPLVGTLLSGSGLPLTIYGTLAAPLHAANLFPCLKTSSRPGQISIAVDASFGEQRQLGDITLKNHGIYPGLGLSRRLPCVGTYSLTGIIGAVDSSSVAGEQKEASALRQLTEADASMVYHCAWSIAQVIRYGISFAGEWDC